MHLQNKLEGADQPNSLSLMWKGFVWQAYKQFRGVRAAYYSYSSSLKQPRDHVRTEEELISTQWPLEKATSIIRQVVRTCLEVENVSLGNSLASLDKSILNRLNAELYETLYESGFQIDSENLFTMIFIVFGEYVEQKKNEVLSKVIDEYCNENIDRVKDSVPLNEKFYAPLRMLIAKALEENGDTFRNKDMDYVTSRIHDIKENGQWNMR